MGRLGRLFLPLALTLATTPVRAADQAVASIDVTATPGGVRLVGRALALSDGRFEASMTIMKGGSSGQTSTTQGSTLDLKRGESADVASVGLSMGAGDTLYVKLVLTSEGTDVASSILTVGGSK